MKLSNRAFWLLLALIAAIVAFVLATQFLIPMDNQICGKNDQTGGYDCAAYDRTLVALWHFGEWANYYGAAVAGLAAIAVAAFTYELNRSTDRLWKSSEREFIAAHRPLIKLRWIRLAPGWPHTVVNFSIVNAGESEAFILGSSINANMPLDGSRLPENPHGEDGRYVRNNRINRTRLGVGATDRYTIDVAPPPGGSGSASVHFYGWIVYRDAGNHPRTTYFYLRLDPSLNQFVPVDEPDYNSDD